MRFNEFFKEATNAPVILGDPNKPTPAGYKKWGVEGKVVFALANMTGDQVSDAIEANPTILQPVAPNALAQPPAQPAAQPAPAQAPAAPTTAKRKVVIGDLNKPAPPGYKKLGVAGQVIYALANMNDDQISAEIEANPALQKVIQQKIDKAKAEIGTPQAQQLRTVAIANGFKDNELNELLAQAAHETKNFTMFSEDMSYSAERLLKVHKKYFNPKTAKAYANKPQQIANRVYANRMGNGDEKSGDGWKYRGRGYLHLTGKDNYARAGADLKIDLLSNPELVNQIGTNGKPGIAEKVALWYWRSRVRPKMTSGDVTAATTGINPAGQGAQERTLKRQQYQQTGIYNENI